MTALLSNTLAGSPIQLALLASDKYTSHAGFSRVELPVCFIWAQQFIAEKVTGGLRLFRECYNVWWGGQLPMLMRPKLPSSPESCSVPSVTRR